jgi:acetoacetate decarboxylase
MRGFTLPLSPEGDLSLVPAPPWHFGGEQIEIIYRTTYEAARALVPEILLVEQSEPVISVVVSRMISTPNADSYAQNPERAQYFECLIKIRCLLRDGRPAWYGPVSWVSKDFSLMRGFVLGFGKRLASIALTEFHELNPAVCTKRVGGHMRGICEAFADTQIVADFTLKEKVEKIQYSGMPLIVNRHYPGVYASEPPDIDRLATLEVDSYRRSDMWTGVGRIVIESTHSAVCALQPIEYVTARSFREGFTLKGSRILNDNEV